MARKRSPVVMTELGRYECRHCSARFAWTSPRPIDPPEQRTGLGGRRGGGKPPAYCSTQCSNRSRKRNATYVYTCQMCGITSSKRHTFTTYCSRLCSNRSRFGWHVPLPADHWALWYGKSSAWKPRKPPSGRRWVAGQCLSCKEHFVSIWLGDASSRYCNDRCARRENKMQRRARTRSKCGSDIGISWKSLSKRDGMHCYLCKVLCDPLDFDRKGNAFVARPRYPSVDHVIPLVPPTTSHLAGTHTWDNVRLACMKCNTTKSNSVSTP